MKEYLQRIIINLEDFGNGPLGVILFGQITDDTFFANLWANQESTFNLSFNSVQIFLITCSFKAWDKCFKNHQKLLKVPSTPESAPDEAAAIVDPLKRRKASSMSRPVAKADNLIFAKDSMKSVKMWNLQKI